MSVQYADRIWEIGTVTGTGTLNLPGVAQTGCRTFNGNITSGNTVAYCIYDTVAYAWETGFGTFTSGSPSTLSRGLYQSSTGSLVNFAGNSCNITLAVLSPITVSAGSGSAGLVPVLNASGLIDQSMYLVGATT